MKNCIHQPAPIVSTAYAEVDLIEPTTDMIHLSDIAKSLSRISRYGGHTGTDWSVLQHLALCDWIAETSDLPEVTEDLGFRQYVVLHDAHEAYTGDIPRPLKQLLDQNGQVEALENRLDAVIFEKFAVPACHGTKHGPMHRSLKQIDNEALSAEVHVCFPEVLSRWEGLPPPNPDHIEAVRDIVGYDKGDTANSFCRRVIELQMMIEAQARSGTAPVAFKPKAVH